MAGFIVNLALLSLVQVAVTTRVGPTVSGGRSLLEFPEYTRGKDYKFVLSEAERENGISYRGSNSRLRSAMDRLKKGETIKITTVGGSITAGQGCVDAPNWPQYVFNFMQDMYGEDKVQGSNGAVGGTLSGYMSVCHNMHVPKDSDIVFVEYSVNDWHSLQPYYENNVRRSFERLLRKLLQYPKRPAVILMHSYVWYQAYPHQGAFWSNTEREFSEFMLYYHLPALSVKSAVYTKMLADEPGFQIGTTRMKDEVGLKDKAFYWDPIHPDGRTGARVMGELAMHLLQTTYDSLSIKPATAEDEAARDAELPAPMIPKNYESISDKCFIGSHFTATVQEKDGWEWINESKSDRPKWGFVTTTVGSALKMLIDTRASSEVGHSPGHGGNLATPVDPSEVLVELAYLKSYEHMGKAQVTCEGDCSCKPTEVQGHGEEKNSQLHLHNFYVSQGEKCVVVVKVLPETNSGEHKFKLAGVMISEETGQHAGIQNHMAVEYVGDISQRSKDGTFDAKNHA